MFKKIMILLSTIVLTFAFVTHQPKKVDAAAGTVVSFAAKQALKAATKSAVADTVGSLALKTATKEVAENYVKKEGLNLVVLEGGKKAMVKTTMNQTEKVALKKEIDNVIDLKIYGNAPGWVKFIDWFVGVGAVVLVGQVLYAAVTGEMSGFITEIFNEAMINLGWMAPAVPLTVDGNVPTQDPVVVPNDTPQYTPRDPVSPSPIPTSHYHNIYDNTSTSRVNGNFSFRFPEMFLHNLTVSYEVMNDSVYNDTRFPMPEYVSSINNYSADYLKNSYPLNLEQLSYYRTLKPGLSTASPLGSDFTYTVKYGNTVLAENYNHYGLSSAGIKMPSDFSYTKYNKLVIQYPTWDKELKVIVSRLYLFSTHFKLPTLFAMATKPFDGSTVPPNQTVDNTIKNFQFQTFSTSSTPEINPIRYRVGFHSSLELALNSDSLPMPKINHTEIKIPMISPETGKIAWPQKTILPDGYTYNPETQEILDPVGNPVTNPETIPELNPDPVIETTPDGEQVIDGVPTGQPAPEPVSPPTGGGGDPITTGDPKEINWAKLKGVPMILTKKFPFSLPWDAQRFMQGVFGDVPQAEEINFKIDKLAGIHFGLDIKIPPYFDSFFDFSRQATVILFDIGLIYALYRLLGGAS